MLVDGILMKAILDLNEPRSILSLDSTAVECLPLNENNTHEVRTQRPNDHFRTAMLSFSRRHVCFDCDVVLGMDWHTKSMPVFDSDAARRVYTDPVIVHLFDAQRPTTCVFQEDVDAVRNECERHDLDNSYMTVEERRRALIIHLFTGQCVNHPLAPGCRSAILPLSYPSRGAVVTFVVSQLRHPTSHRVPTTTLKAVCGMLQLPVRSEESRPELLISLGEYALAFNLASGSHFTNLNLLESMTSPMLKQALCAHNLRHRTNEQVDSMKRIIWKHISTGECIQTQWAQPLYSNGHYARGCLEVQNETGILNGAADNRLSEEVLSRLQSEMRIAVLRYCNRTLAVKPLRRILSTYGILQSKETHPSIDTVRYTMKGLIVSLQTSPTGAPEDERSMGDNQWPRKQSDALKAKLVTLFKEATGKLAMKTFTCAICGEERMILNDICRLELSEFDHSLLQDRRPSSIRSWHSTPNVGPLGEIIVDQQGVQINDSGPVLFSCRDCREYLVQKKQLPPLSLANSMYAGPVPEELRDLTIVEESMIARCRAKCWILQLKDEGSEVPNSQRALRGHVMIFPQSPESLASILPPTVEEVTKYICVIFVGSRRPSQAWLKERAKPLVARRNRVHRALIWLKAHNKLYGDVTIDERRIMNIPESDILPFMVHCQSPESQAATTSTYDPTTNTEAAASSGRQLDRNDIIFESVVIADVERESSTNSLKAAAIRHLTKSEKRFVQIPHGTDPSNEFQNPDLFPMMYPTLFPFGIGGIEESDRLVPVGMERHVRHLLRLSDRRFQVHPSFMFSAFNIIQRRQALRQTKLKVDAPYFGSIAKDLAEVSSETVQRVAEKVASGLQLSRTDREEVLVQKLMREVKMITKNVYGSAQSRMAMRSELKALMMTTGMPSFFVTVNPADVYNPLVAFLAGKDIDIDRMLPDEVPNFWEQSILVARNPIVPSKFFNVYMKAFITYILGYECPDEEVAREGGVLGRIRAYYGCVEAQGRGTLHCHMLIWVEGALNPNEIRDRIIAEPKGEFVSALTSMLDDTISNYVPAPGEVASDEKSRDLPHPCSIRGPNRATDQERQNDLHRLVKQCQSHEHKATCYKYWKGPPAPKECRFDLDERNARPVTTVNEETGEISLRCLNGLVNNYNKTMIEAVRCNMDIKFIGSGQSAKAVLYYVTDYISKTQLKTHVAYAALEVAAKKLEMDARIEDHTDRAKRLIQKCAYAVMSHQELSAPQVASYLLGFEDHFTSHRFRPVWLMSFEAALVSMSTHENTTEKDKAIATEVSGIVECDHDGQSPHLYNASTEGEVMLDKAESIVVPRASAVADYLLRPGHFDAVCLWDFVARTTKKQISRIRVPQRAEDGSPRDDIFLGEHPECDTHTIRWLAPQAYVVPVPMGQGIPRRDRLETRERYCRLMLVLFKPWRNPADLLQKFSTWDEAFKSFTKGCSSHHMYVMENMQLLHECRDSRDDHFEQRRNRRRATAEVISTAWMTDVNAENDDLHADDTEEDILAHLQSIEDSRSLKRSRLENNATSCTMAAEEAGLFGVAPQSAGTDFCCNSTHVESKFPYDFEIAGNDELSLESTWRQMYDRMRDERKKRFLTTSGILQSDSAIQSAGRAEIRSLVLGEDNNTHESARGTEQYSINALTQCHDDTKSGLEQGSSNGLVTIDAMEREFTLNPEQSRAFRMICSAAIRRNSEPLRVYVGGGGGTGKSRIILAVREFFKRRGEDRRLRLASYTGVAAHNVLGMTLHAALSLNSRSQKSGRGKSRQDQIAMWEGVDFLFIDEISMIGCQFLLDIHQALTEAKSSPAPFGGINVVLAGDFAQLPPVGQTKLFAKLNIKLTARSGTTSGQRNVLGKLLWLQVQDVVLLHRPMRQVGPENLRFVELLQRLRIGKCTDEDFDLLKTRIGRRATGENAESWINVPMIVGDNASKDVLNEKATIAYARRSGTTVNWYYASDYHRGSLVRDPRLVEEIQTYHSGQTGYRLSRLPLARGMPVILSQNYDVENGAVNGTVGTLTSVRYLLGDDGRRRAKSCVINSPSYEGEALPTLQRHEIPVLEDQVDLTFIHPHTGKKCSLKRSQLPIQPSFAITVYKAQGLTFPRIVADLQSCLSIEAAYVMLSRVKSLEGLMILRPFDRKKITSRQSEDSRREFSRLDVLNLQTKRRQSDDVDEQRRIDEELQSKSLPCSAYQKGDARTPAQVLQEYQESLEACLLPQRPAAPGIAATKKRVREWDESTPPPKHTRYDTLTRRAR